MKVTDTRSIDFLWYICIFLIDIREMAPNCGLRRCAADLSCYQIESSWQMNILHFTFCYHFFLNIKMQVSGLICSRLCISPMCIFGIFFKKEQVSVVKEGYIDASVDLYYVFVPTKCWFINKVLYNNLKLSVVKYWFCLGLIRQYLVFCPYISIFWNYF